MKVQLLGTGSADGWPNPFCVCPSCDSQRRSGHARAASCALVDEVMLIDWGPTLANAASRNGIALNAVHHLLFTHGHPDHLAPEFLLWRSWISDLQTLHIYGPAQAISRFEHWVQPQAPVAFHVVQSGSEFTASTAAGDMHVRVLPAAHGHGNGDPYADEALLYDITASDGDRLLYATDTGPLNQDCLALVADRAFTLLLIEETFGRHFGHDSGHLDLRTLPTALHALRAVGAVDAGTDIVAFHLSHHNPPKSELALELAGSGARIVDDGAIIDTRRAPNERILIVGGARSGKSAFAESLAGGRAHVTYLATGGDRPDDPEWSARIALHRQRRPPHWITLESADAAALIRAHEQGTMLVDCVSLWLAHALDRAGVWETKGAEQTRALTVLQADVDELVDAVACSTGQLIIVTNEVGQGVVPATFAGRLFRDLLGIVNARLSAVCTQGYFVVAGQVLPLETVQSLMKKDADV